MNNGDILSVIESTIPFLTKSETKIADYILNNPKDILLMSIKELSKVVNVSEPSVIRFSKKLGLSGYSEFKILLSATLSNDTNPISPINVNLKDTPHEIYTKLANYTIASINSTSNTLETMQMENCIDLIFNTWLNGGKIYLSGMGSSSIFVKYLQTKLMRLNIQSVFYEDIHLRLEAIANIDKKDLLICFTVLGSSKEAYQMIDIAKSNSAKVITITQFGNSKIYEKSDVTLYTSIIENNLRLATQTSMAVYSLIIDAIFISLAIRIGYDKILSDVNNYKELSKKLGYTINTF